MPNVFADLRDEGLQPHAVSDVYVAAAEKGETFVDISDTIDLKIQALRQHASQFPGDWDPGDMVREWAAETGKRAGVPFAEAFLHIELDRHRRQEAEEHGTDARDS
jgi:LmbE family N-acetylglucosaminyl deacetylase